MKGKKLWEIDLHELYGKDHLWWDQGTSPVPANGNVVIAVMQTEGVMGIKAGGSGDITKEAVLWRKKLPSPDAATLVARDGKVFLFVDRGKIVENKMGEAIIASPIAVNNSLIVRSDKHFWCLR